MSSDYIKSCLRENSDIILKKKKIAKDFNKVNKVRDSKALITDKCNKLLIIL